MSGNQDFFIENGVLIKYYGYDEAVAVPKGVTEIGRYAFAHCTNLRQVAFPDGLTVIGESAFSGCTGPTFHDADSKRA